MDPILLQKQLKDNANDLQDFCKDLKNWGQEMKRKEDNLKKPAVAEIKAKKLKKKDSIKKPATKIGATDYAKWDKFDPDAEEESDEDSELTDEYDETSRDEALVEKEKGNKFVKEQKWKEAIKCYTKAIDSYSYDPIFYANRALCYLRIGEMNKAEIDCDMSLKLDSTYVKAYQRRAAAREAQNKLSEAKQDLLKVLKFEPKNQETRNALDILRTKMGEDVKSPDFNAPRPVSKFTASRQQSNKIVETIQQNSTKVDDSIIYIKPFKKPPHLRSKKPLKRIHIEEKDFITSPLVKEPEVEAFKSKVVERVVDSKPIIESNHKYDNNPKFKTNQKPQLSDEILSKEIKNLCNDRKLQDSKYTPVRLLEKPTTSVQFNLTWDSLNKTTSKHSYMQIIEPTYLPKLFQDSLETKYFSEILEVLAKHALDEGTPVYEYLRNLTKVRRFSMLTMFMSGSDKNNVRKLLDYAMEKEGKTKEEIDELMVEFEL